jgi:hypothetical protein
LRVKTWKQAVVTGTPTARSHAHNTTHAQSTGHVTRRTSASRTQGAPVSGSNSHTQTQTHLRGACTYIHHDSWTDGGPANTHQHTTTCTKHTHSELKCSIHMHTVDPVQARLNWSNIVTTCTTKRPLDTRDCNTRIRLAQGARTHARQCVGVQPPRTLRPAPPPPYA